MLLQSFSCQNLCTIFRRDVQPQPVKLQVPVRNFFLNFKYTYEVNAVILASDLDLADENTIIIFPTFGQDINYLLSHEKMQNYYLRWHCMDAYTAIFVPKTIVQ